MDKWAVYYDSNIKIFHICGGVYRDYFLFECEIAWYTRGQLKKYCNDFVKGAGFLQNKSLRKYYKNSKKGNRIHNWSNNLSF